MFVLWEINRRAELAGEHLYFLVPNVVIDRCLDLLHAPDARRWWRQGAMSFGKKQSTFDGAKIRSKLRLLMLLAVMKQKEEVKELVDYLRDPSCFRNWAVKYQKVF